MSQCKSECGCTPSAKPCCGSAPRPASRADQKRIASCIIGIVKGPQGDIPIVSTRLKTRDILGGWRIRWNFRRMDYAIPPGVYGVGSPQKNSPVLVTANYKFTFDRLRRHLAGIDAWILVVDTHGVNVWCAAGKGTFGTDEVIGKIVSMDVSLLVDHKQIILPQLSATGVSGHEVTKKTGFHVVWGPVRASDLPDFLKNGLKAEPAWRQVTFCLPERLAVIPVELAETAKYVIPVTLAVLSLQTLLLGTFERRFVDSLIPYIVAIFLGCGIMPIFLPIIPGRALTLKGWLLGIAATAIFVFAAPVPWLSAIAYFLMLPALSALSALFFTGTTTYTSFSGVKKETRIGLPLIFASSILGAILMIAM